MEKYNWADPQSGTAFPIAKAGYPFIFAFAFITAVLALIGLTFLTVIALIMTVFTCCFFRDPDRVIPDGNGLVVSPADGKVVAMAPVSDSPLGKEPCLKVSIFMSIFNVHVNRVPCDGNITGIDYHPGKFFSANLDKASAENEHNKIFLRTENNQRICFVQIAGLVARRIICHLSGDETVIRGQRFGMICFGSRLDVYLPADTKLRVTLGDKVQAGTSVLGTLL